MATPVWLLGSTFEPRGSSLYTLRLASRLAEHGFEPLIVCRSGRHIPARLRSALAIREAPHIANRFWRSWRLRTFVREYLDDPPALIHAQSRPAAEWAMEFAAAFVRPYLVTVHDILHTGESLLANPEHLKAVVAVSPSVVRDLVVHASVPSAWVHMIASGVELPTAHTTASERPVNRVPVVGMASVLEPVKGALYFLMAAELILSSGHDVEFVVAGTGPEEETLRRAARHLDIANRVTFVGYVFDYEELLDAVDVFVVPSLEEGLGTIMLEAMALGKPVVATRVGGIADFFEDGEQALLVPKAHHVALAEKIQYLLDNPAKAKKLASAGQQFVRDAFTVERMVKETAKLYREIIRNSQEASEKAASAG
jgi:glycosyltransferase involved in cell wall biosynthesis